MQNLEFKSWLDSTVRCSKKKKKKAEKTLPWHSGAAFRSFLGPISRNPFSDWNKRTKWQLVIDLVASSPRQKYLLIMYTMLYVICTAFYYILCLHFPSLFFAYMTTYIFDYRKRKYVNKFEFIRIYANVAST